MLINFLYPLKVQFHVLTSFLYFNVLIRDKTNFDLQKCKSALNNSKHATVYKRMFAIYFHLQYLGVI